MKYVNRKYTQTTKKLTDAKFAQIKASALKNATSNEMKKFINSSKFKTTINQNIRLNRIRANEKRITSISRKLGLSGQNTKYARQLLGERYTPTGNRYKLSSTTQTKRLQRIQRQVSKNPDYFKRVIAQNQQYRENKQYLPKGVSISEMLSSTDRDQFYYENKNEVIIHNKNQRKYGSAKASEMKEGKYLSKQHALKVQDETKELIGKVLL